MPASPVVEDVGGNKYVQDPLLLLSVVEALVLK